jgi:hypothetical protein
MKKLTKGNKKVEKKKNEKENKEKEMKVYTKKDLPDGTKVLAKEDSVFCTGEKADTFEVTLAEDLKVGNKVLAKKVK